jgi:hypothetical protein
MEIVVHVDSVGGAEEIMVCVALCSVRNTGGIRKGTC